MDGYNGRFCSKYEAANEARLLLYNTMHFRWDTLRSGESTEYALVSSLLTVLLNHAGCQEDLRMVLPKAVADVMPIGTENHRMSREQADYIKTQHSTALEIVRQRLLLNLLGG